MKSKKQDFFFQVSADIYDFGTNMTWRKAIRQAQDMANKWGKCLLVSLEREVEFLRQS